MKTQNGFTLLNKNEIASYLAKQKVTRKITRLQVHHMDLPNYSTWEKTDKKVFSEPHFGRTQSLNDYGRRTWGRDASDGHGHYIAQHFNVFPDGKITTGRHLNSTPIGIRGWNTNAICIEIYGNFDKGQDTMTQEQRKAVIMLYGELCKKFKLTPSTTTIRCHAWFTSGGTYLGDYVAGRSRKTCPGTNFMGIGNSRAAFDNKFIPMVKAYMNGTPTTNTTTANSVGVYKVIVDELNIRQGPGTGYSVAGSVHKGGVYTITQISGSWGKLKSGAGWININAKYCTKVK